MLIVSDPVVLFIDLMKFNIIIALLYLRPQKITINAIPMNEMKIAIENVNSTTSRKSGR